MGMDYQFAGSASYGRFDREVCTIAEVFGGTKTEHLTERLNTEHERPFGYWFGFMSSDDSKEPKFAFPKDTNETLVKWFNNIYHDYTPEETKQIWKCISEHPEIGELSEQIYYELCTLNALGKGWHIT